MSYNNGGFFSLNRLFGKKIKHEKASSIGVSKSSMQTLTRSITDPEGISPQNKIVPLATIPNAPFEQTFRITVYLPLGQLYVARIGAKTKLSELLSTICINKSLDSNKFEFKHPTDDSQVFDLSFTVGEVGLSEIKLAPKTSKEDTAVKYRIHSNFSRENRLHARPHTMSSVSPYSSTNSLNSNDSSGMMMYQRVNSSGVPVAPNRKKRIAPRPPSQNSIPENPEKIFPKDEFNSQNNCIVEDPKVDFKRSNMMRQNFHMSSPNLAINNTIMFKSNTIDTNATVTSSFDRRQSENCLNNNKKIPLDRPLSIQLSKTENHDHTRDFRSQISENLNSRKSQNHSETPSDTAAINDITFPEPQPRSRPPINKKKAPAPPPRTVSTNPNVHPIATPRNIDIAKLNIEDATDKKLNDETHKQTRDDNSVKKLTNVSKVMLNVNETSIELSNINDKVNNVEENALSVANSSDSNDQEKTASNENSPRSTSQPKSISVVNLNSSSCEQCDEMNANDQIAVSLQVNEIIEEAVKNTEIDKRYDEHPQLDYIDEINNNNNNAKGHQEGGENGEANWKYDHNEQTTRIPTNTGDSENMKTATTEVPIQPVLNVTRTFSFQEYSDNSLPTSTTSTLNTTETPSTGPESLITSDIEDGYKGNELEKKRKMEIAKRDSKEDFIESQFEFLKEHLDGKTNIDSDEEKTIDFSKRDIISSTMIHENSKVASKIQSVDKKDVINELTQIISCNRLDTFIKPNTEPSDSVVTSKRSSLKNFQISSYSNGNYEITNSKPSSCFSAYSIQQTSSFSEPSEQAITQYTNTTNELSSAVDDKLGSSLNGNAEETFVIAKQVNRSVSFHSASAINGDMSIVNSDMEHISSAIPRRNSFLSQDGSAKYEHNNVSLQENSAIESGRQKSLSELSIADTPSLQSIKVMKSILNSSIQENPDSKNTQEEEEISVDGVKEKGTGSQTCSDSGKPNATNQKKGWIYQGPPSINFSTWGDRPKSTVNIKSDEDYIFGETSKIATLQKRFSGVETETKKEIHPSSELIFTKGQCDNGSKYKLPIVRSVEYKKNKKQNDDNAATVDFPDSGQPESTFRSNYEVSHIVASPCSDDHAGYKTTKPVPTQPIHSPQSINSKTDFMLRVQSFNNPNKNQSVNQLKVAKEAETKELEKPRFTQFKLRKTGLKERMFDNSRSDDTKILNGSRVETDSKPIVAAPKPPPPPILAKPKIRPVSMNIQTDTRGQLLDSIRNFNRDTLKRNIIY